MSLEIESPCKVNLLLNVIGRRPDGFHELETVMHPVRLHDRLTFERAGQGIQLTCSSPDLPRDSRNLVHRAAVAFCAQARIQEGIRIHLEKWIPLAAGLGGGSSDAAATLLGLNELYQEPLPQVALFELAKSLGSDVPFFLQPQPALATGRGEEIQLLDPFPALRGCAFLLVHPGFGISTAWVYEQLIHFPAAMNGEAGRAARLVKLLQTGDLPQAGAAFYNALEAPVLAKYPYLELIKDFLRQADAPAVLMSGSGSTIFALLPGEAEAAQLRERVRAKFDTCWLSVVPV